MIPTTRLHIRLTPGLLRPRLGIPTINEIRGGPETLLRWMETQLGLPCRDVPRANCITEYAGALDAVTDGVICASLKADRWATASDLLRRRDELMLSGWNHTNSESLPEIVQDLARAAVGRTFIFPNVAERLMRIVDAIGRGQRLPPHQCMLVDAPELWPLRWREVLRRLNTVPAHHISPAARDGTALQVAQKIVLGRGASHFAQDSSFRYVQTLSQTAAVEFVASAMANDTIELSKTVVVCEDDHLAVQLDACLNRMGLPTMGASAWSKAHPALQVLPLTLALCWEPVNPQTLLDFLTLPISPIPRRAASKLANALAEEPGLGSGQWEANLNELCAVENDPDGALRQQISCWLLCERVPWGEEIPSRLIRDRCSLVAQWAAGRATTLKGLEQAELQLAQALQSAASQSALLGELAGCQGDSLSEPQLARLLEEALAGGVEATGFIEAAGGPVRVRSLAEINYPCQRLIWLGLGTADVQACPWSTQELNALRTAGVDIDDGSKAIAALRHAEATGLCQVQRALLAVLLPQDIEKRWHPLWLAMRSMLPEHDIESPPVLENLIASGTLNQLSPFAVEIDTAEIDTPLSRRPLWEIPMELFRNRPTISATELEDRLACPLKWVLSYQARLRSSPIARLPDDFRLKGTFCHGILQRVFGDGGDLPSVETGVARIIEMFDQRIGLDAAPLAQPDKLLERKSLRSQLAHSTRILISALANKGYKIKGIEVELSGEAFGKSLLGRIDCLAECEGGEEVLIDFKYGSRTKYRDLIKDGKAVQLATYAYSRFVLAGRFPAVAYLILSNGQLHTLSASLIDANSQRSVIDGIEIDQVWDRFVGALERAGGWLTGEQPIPARPLLPANEWPDGSDIVLDPRLPPTDMQAVCKYCDYQLICGLRELR